MEIVEQIDDVGQICTIVGVHIDGLLTLDLRRSEDSPTNGTSDDPYTVVGSPSSSSCWGPS